MNLDLDTYVRLNNKLMFSNLSLFDIVVIILSIAILGVFAYRLACKYLYLLEETATAVVVALSVLCIMLYITNNQSNLAEYSQGTRDSLVILQEKTKIDGVFTVKELGTEITKCGISLTKSFNCVPITVTDKNDKEVKSLILTDWYSKLKEDTQYELKISTYTEPNSVTGYKFDYVMEYNELDEEKSSTETE